MNKRTWLSILGGAFLLSAAPVMYGAAHPGGAQTSSSSTTKKKHSSSRSRRRSRAKGQAAPTPDRVKEIQTALQREGAYDGKPTGKWDEATSEAMRKYQDQNGLNPTGKIDALSLEKLGMGSQTAGKGAPVSAASTPSTALAPSPSVAPAPSPSSSAAPAAADPPSK